MAAGITVLTPGGRLARHLRWRAGCEARQGGATAWPTADIVTLSQWWERLWERSLVTGGAAGRRMLLDAGQFRHVSCGIIDELSAHHGSGSGVERLVRDARSIAGNWQIGAHDLRAAASGPDTAFFAAWAERFSAVCHERDWVDAPGLTELLLPELAEGLRPVPRSIVLAGFDYPTVAQQRLINCLTDAGALAGRIAGPCGDSIDGLRICCAEPAAERRLAARWARSRFDTRPGELIGVVVPGLSRSAGAWRRSFLDAFDPAWRERDGMQFPVSVADGARLADAEIVRSALLLLRVPEGRLDYRELGRLLRSPYLGGADVEADERARLDLRLRADGLQHVNLQTLSKRFGAAGRPGAADGNRSGPLIFFRIIDELLAMRDDVRRRRDPGNWAASFEIVLRAAQFCRVRKLSRRDETVLEDWRRAIERFAALGVVTGPVGYRRALALLRETVHDQPLHRAGRDDGVQIMTPAEAVGMRFDALWLCGMTSAAWPGEPRPSPLIPLALQRARQIPEALPDRYRERALFEMRSLFAGAGERVASFAAHDGEESLVPSPQILSLTEAVPSTLGIDVDTDDPGGIGWSPNACTTEVPDPAPPLGATETAGGGSRLVNLQSECPARAFFELRLGAQELVTPPFALDAATRGKLMHDAADHLYAAFLSKGGPLSAAASDLDSAIEAAITRSLARHISPSHPLADTLCVTERARLGRMLGALIERDRQRGPVATVELENRHRVAIGGLEMILRFDRVDRSGEGARLVIDYKTGAFFSATKWFGERPLDMQLPLYAAVGDADGIALYWLHAKKLRITGIGVEDWGIRNGLPKNDKGFRVVAPDAWQQQVADWRAICERLVDEFRQGDCRVDVANDDRAIGEYAMLTRRWALGPAGPDCE